jgi:translation initiation factor 4E
MCFAKVKRTKQRFIFLVMSALPLSKSWTLWHDKSWHDLKAIHSFDTVASFWTLFNSLSSPSQIDHMQNLRIFHTSVHPSSEDPVNMNGGKWIVQFYSNTNIDTEWQNLILDLIGNTNPLSWGITGIEINIRRRGHRISIWVDNCNLKTQTACGKYLRQNCGVSIFSIHFKKHSDIKMQKGAFATSYLLTS